MSNGPILSADKRYRCNGCTHLREKLEHKRNLYLCFHADVFCGLALIGLTDATPDWCPFLKLRSQPKASADGE